MLSAILQALTGQTLLDYLQPRLFEPLLMAQPVWESNPHGINLGGTGLRLTTMDVAKFGQLYLQRGVWNGQRIVPEAWIEEATSMQIANGDDPNSDWTQGYGFQFWRCRHQAYRGDGAFGQFCIVLPQQQVVLAMTSGTSEMQGILNVVWDHLLPGLHADPLPERADEAQALNENQPVPIAAHGGWRDEQTFVMTWQYIETPFRRIITVEFHGDHVEPSARPDLSFREIVSKHVQGRL